MKGRSPVLLLVAALLAAAAVIVVSPRADKPGRTPRSAAEQVGAGLPRADSIIRSWVDAGTIPGAVFSVALDGRPLFEAAYGQAQLNPAVPMESNTVFDLASLTKVMATTFAVMLLVDRGALDLDAPISEVLSDFTGEGKETVTARQLLTHRAGLHPWQPTYYVAADGDGVYAYVRDLPLLSRAGEERRYSDLGFMLLGRMVETLSGQKIDAFLDDALFGPLGLESTGYRADGVTQGRAPQFAATSHGNPFERRMVHDTTFGYRFAGDPESWNGWRERQLVGEVNDGNAFHAFGGVAGHAGLFSNAAELQILLGVLLAGGTGDTTVENRRFISAAMLEEFLTDSGDNQALGWQIPDYASPGSFTHTGFTGTWVLGVPALGLGVVLLTNRQNGGVDSESRYPDVSDLQRAVGEALVAPDPRINPR